jgi:dextranase
MRIVITVSIVFLLFSVQGNAQDWISTDKAVYYPGDSVSFFVKRVLPTGTRVRYTHLGAQVGDGLVFQGKWKWLPPMEDFAGYLAELYQPQPGGGKKSLGSIAVDVSSDWGHFPRYGFLSWYSKMPKEKTAGIISRLERFHINGLQFYDWQFKHQKPLGLKDGKPIGHWKDIGDRDNYFTTVKQFIRQAHAHGMKTMSYNLIYGALNDAAADGVKDEWYLYQDSQHREKEIFRLPEPFTSPIYLLDPSNPGWQEYIAAQNQTLYSVLDFNGYHIDQLGNRDKRLYTYAGKEIGLPATFRSFIEAMKKAAPSKSLAMNSVNQYGQEGIAASPATFLYTEIWPPDTTFADMVHIILQNDSLSGNTKKTVLAAYMDYRLADHKGFFNTAGILLADACIFAFGGSHLELGDHMLDKEYFPQDSLKMKPGLMAPLLSYYDFSVAYQNLLRGGGERFDPGAHIAGHRSTGWPPAEGAIAVTGLRAKGFTVLQLLNFTDATTMDWQDNKGVQQEPKTMRGLAVSFPYNHPVKKLWWASPDTGHGVPATLPFSQKDGQISVVVPQLKYWDMIVVEE